MEDMQITYKGHVIRWCDFNQTFQILLEETVLKDNFKTVDACEKYIDGRTKERWKKMPVYIRSDFGKRVKKGEETSIIDEDYAWITENRVRCKKGLTSLFPVNQHNTAIAGEIESYYSAIAKLNKRIDTLYASLECFTPAMMKEYSRTKRGQI